MTGPSHEISAWEIEPISTILQQIHYQYVTKRMRSVSIASQLRGEGKTTLGITMARGMVEVFKFNILYVDLNSQGDSLLSKYLKDYSTKDGMVQNHQFPFSILRVKDMEIDWSKNVFDGPFLNQLITRHSSHYDMIIVDNPTATTATDTILKINTDTNIIVRSPKSKDDALEKEIIRDRKKLLGVVFNEI